MVFFTRRFAMDLRKCDHCGNTFWSNSKARFCPLCALAEKAKVKTIEPHRESKDRPLQTATR
jgi:ABC-type ATPase with predicted acetyltransferase domain